MDLTIEEVRQVLNQLPKPPVFKPKEGVRIAENDAELEQMNNEGDSEIDAIIEECKALMKS